MTERAAHLLDEVLKLTQAERAEIASSLLTSLDDDEADMDQAAVDAAWKDEIRRRADRVLAGEPGIAWEQVRAEAEAKRKK
jgi:putative addiction module component (TIGR02574 family)